MGESKMETRDLAIKYRAICQEIQLIMDNIKEIGFDISEDEKKVAEIKKRVSESIKVDYTGGYARANYEADYAKGIGELNKIKRRLEDFDRYFRVLNSCHYLGMKCSESNITNEQLEKYVSEMIYDLKIIISTDTTDYDTERHIVEAVYEMAYKLIKLEIIMTGDSNIYQYAKAEDINVAYFNTLIKADINKLKLDKYPAIKEKVYEIRRQGISSSYFDLELIKRLLVSDNKLDLKKPITDRIMSVTDEIGQSTRKIEELLKALNNSQYSEGIIKNNLKDEYRNLRYRLTTFLVTLSLMIGGGIGIQKAAKAIATEDAYIETTEIYSSATDELTTSSKKVFASSEPIKEVTIKDYQPYESDDERTYVKYDVSFHDFDTLKEYYEYGIDNYGVVGKVDNDTKRNGATISNYRDKYTEVISTTYEYNGVETNPGDYVSFLILFYFLYLLPLFLIELAYYGFTDCKTVIIGSISELKDIIADIISYKKTYKNERARINEIIDKIMAEINKNEELRNKFNELYEQNKYLLDRPEELYKKVFDETEMQKLAEAKKLVRVNKKGR